MKDLFKYINATSNCKFTILAEVSLQRYHYQRGRWPMERREDLHDGQLGVASVGCRGTLHAQSWRCNRSGPALAWVCTGDQIPLGEEYPDTWVSSKVISLFVISMLDDESSLSSMRAHGRLHPLILSHSERSRATSFSRYVNSLDRDSVPLETDISITVFG